MTERRLNRTVIKEEFVALTGGFVRASLLGQLEYWQARAKDIDAYLAEERKRAERSGEEFTANETAGWIFKSADELADEAMVGTGRKTTLEHLKAMVDEGWILRRKNPYQAWDQTYQYRLDLHKIREDLRGLGYELQDWVFPGGSGGGNGVSPTETSNVQKGNIEQPQSKHRSEQNETAIPGTTTGITTSSSGEAATVTEIDSLPDDTTSYCLLLLQRVKGFPRNQGDNALYLGELRREFPSVDARNVVREFQVWMHDNEGKTKNPRSRLRNFFKKASDDGAKTGGHTQRVQDSAGGHAQALGDDGSGGTPQVAQAAIREHARLSRYVNVAKMWDFTQEEEPPDRVVAKLGGTWDERNTNLHKMKVVSRRAVAAGEDSAEGRAS